MNGVIRAVSYTLAHTTDMVTRNGTTQTTEQVVNPNSEYLRELPSHIRSYRDAVAYAPNQTYIGNLTPDELAAIPQPWYENPVTDAPRYGVWGEIMPQEEFYLLMQICDTFDLVLLEETFAAQQTEALFQDPAIPDALKALVKPGVSEDELRRHLEHGAEGLYSGGALVGCVNRAHDVDENLAAHVMLENLCAKATSVLSILHLLHSSAVPAEEIDYVIDCCEESAGDMNQRGGCNFAKAAAEIAGLSQATGSDVRGFCAAPAHAIVHAAALVKAGVYKNVLVTAGGCTAKLGMNGKDHVKKGLPILEDALGGFSVLISANDGVSPEINTDIVGSHKVGTGSSPQNVITSLVLDPLRRNGLKILDIGKYSAEMQNAEITRPAGAGDVPLANYKMIGALAVKEGELERARLMDFTKEHGMVGWAPTQGHIPSGVPYLGFAKKDIESGAIEKAMILGKGSLFLGRMTNLFDGISFVVQANTGAGEAADGADIQTEIRTALAGALRKLALAVADEGQNV